MNKQTFTIPEGCKAVTVEQVGNQIITTFEPQFKRGDVIYCEDNDGFNWVFILKEKTNRGLNPYEHFCIVTSTGGVAINDFCRHPERIFRHATPQEAQLLWDALAKEGKRWNPETMQVEEIKKEIPMAKLFEVYYFVESNSRRVIESSETKDRIDSERHRYGNYFLSKEQAQRAAYKLKSALDEFWNEELK